MKLYRIVFVFLFSAALCCQTSYASQGLNPIKAVTRELLELNEYARSLVNTSGLDKIDQLFVHFMAGEQYQYIKRHLSHDQQLALIARLQYFDYAMQETNPARRAEKLREAFRALSDYITRVRTQFCSPAKQKVRDKKRSAALPAQKSTQALPALKPRTTAAQELESLINIEGIDKEALQAVLADLDMKAERGSTILSEIMKHKKEILGTVVLVAILAAYKQNMFGGVADQHTRNERQKTWSEWIGGTVAPLKFW